VEKPPQPNVGTAALGCPSSEARCLPRGHLATPCYNSPNAQHPPRINPPLPFCRRGCVPALVLVPSSDLRNQQPRRNLFLYHLEHPRISRPLPHLIHPRQIESPTRLGRRYAQFRRVALYGLENQPGLAHLQYPAHLSPRRRPDPPLLALVPHGRRP